MNRVKIKETAQDFEFLEEMFGIDTSIVYQVSKKDNGTYEIHGFQFEEEELYFLD